jgi:hypothetical protein
MVAVHPEKGEEAVSPPETTIVYRTGLVDSKTLVSI